jgi:hypothetical protein
MKMLYVSAFALALAACSGAEGRSPTSPAPLVASPAPIAPPAVEEPQRVDSDSCEFKMTVLDAAANRDDKFGYLKVRNNGQCDRVAGVAIYKPINNGLPFTLDNQELVSNDFKMVKPGETVELFAYLPPCDRFQYDPYHSMTITGRSPNFGNGENLFDISQFTSHYGDTGECAALPAPPVPPTVPPIVSPHTAPAPPVCPVVTPANYKQYITNASVVADSATSAVMSFKVNVPAGCTVSLSVVSYRVRTCGVKFPQQFIDGSTKDGSAMVYGPGTYVNQMRVKKTATEYQVDLRIEGFEPGHELTQKNENSYYRGRTLAWIFDQSCSSR